MTEQIVQQQYALVAVDELSPHPANPRRGDVDAIAASIDANGFYGSVVAQRSTGYVLAGNHRLLAARERGIETLPVIWLDVDDDRARRILLVDNRSNDVAGYDEAQLVELLRDFGGELDGTGYTDDDLLALMSSLDVADAASPDGAQHSEDELYSRFSREQIVDAAVAHYRERGFPFRSLPLHEQMQQLNRLATLDNDALLHSNLCYHVADTYHPHRFSVPIPGKHSPVDSFEHDGRLRVAFEMIANDDKTINDASLLQTLGMVRGSQAAANFRPAFALLLYRRFAPEDATVLDTSTGFGGRLLGFAASRCSRYIGVDPNVPTHEGNLRMSKTLGIDGVELINLPAEDVDAEPLRESCDFAFTSPPYFSKERYSDDDTQSWKRYATGDAWRDGFLSPMLALQHAALRPGAHNIINIADVTIGSTLYPLMQWTCDVAQELGFELLRVERFPLPRVPGNGEAPQRFEPVIVLRKPERK